MGKIKEFVDLRCSIKCMHNTLAADCRYWASRGSYKNKK